MQEVIDILAVIAKKDLHELTEQDTAILKARRAYLTDEQAAKFAEILEEHKPATAPAPKYEELKAKATEMGVEFKASIKKDDLIALIEAKKKELAQAAA